METVESIEGPKEDCNPEGAETEDIPSDFFDDFSKDDFMEGLSVIDSWDDDEHGRRRIDTKTLDSVKDLRELIGDSREYDSNEGSYVKFDGKYKWRSGDKSSRPDHPESTSRLDDFIKPGSRRDPNKTNEAIRKDKEVKVKEYLAKHLESSDDIRPPGTELDDYFEEKKQVDRKKTPTEETLGHHSKSPRHHSKSPRRRSKSKNRITEKDRITNKATRRRSRSRDLRETIPVRRERDFQQHRYHRYSPGRYQRNPRWSPQHSYRNIGHRSPPRKYRRSSPRSSPRRYSPRRRSPRHSRSPLPFRQHYSSRHSRSPSSRPRDSFLYPQDNVLPYASATSSFQGSAPVEYSGSVPGYSYPQGPYPGYGGPGYEYGVQPEIPVAMQLPQPVPAPALDPSVPGTNPAVAAVHNPVLAPAIHPAPMNPVPAMVPAPMQAVSPSVSRTLRNASNAVDVIKPFDALAQLVAEGKISKADYLKLTPNKGVSVGNQLEPKTRGLVLTRCSQALSKLGKLNLPNQLIVKNILVGQEPKSLTPKYCSPLKRQVAVEFQFTKSSGAKLQENKQLVDSIIATIGLDKVVSRPKKKAPRDMKDAAVQTTRSFCDVCEIRESTKCNEVGTSMDLDHFTSSIHTQVVEQDLVSSKSFFNPTGSATDSAPISIAHLTPAQLVSQLAARAKTLKQTSEPAQNHNQFGWRNPPNNYDNRGNQYHNNYNYRY